MVIGAVITGTGKNVPDKVIPNSYFESYLNTTDEWILDRTGISERRWASEVTSASDLALPACFNAINSSGISKDQVDGIICATVTPDYIFPSTACVLQGKLGIKNGFAFDVNAVCSGFLYALTLANSLIKSGQARNILVVGTEIYSRIIDKNDRTTCLLFGDGCGAVLLSRREFENEESSFGVLNTNIGSDGSHVDILCVPNGTANTPTAESLESGAHFLKMNGREVFKLAVRKLAEINRDIVLSSGYQLSDVNWFVSHQANKRILQSVAADLNISADRVPMNIQKYGNTSAASVPLLLSEMNDRGDLKKGDLIVLSAFGGGVTWGSALIKWA